jgi:hypothetical protein
MDSNEGEAASVAKAGGVAVNAGVVRAVVLIGAAIGADVAGVVGTIEVMAMACTGCGCV